MLHPFRYGKSPAQEYGLNRIFTYHYTSFLIEFNAYIRPLTVDDLSTIPTISKKDFRILKILSISYRGKLELTARK
jgi:hypothetical protein